MNDRDTIIRGLVNKPHDVTGLAMLADVTQERDLPGAGWFAAAHDAAKKGVRFNTHNYRLASARGFNSPIGRVEFYVRHGGVRVGPPLWIHVVVPTEGDTGQSGDHAARVHVPIMSWDHLRSMSAGPHDNTHWSVGARLGPYADAPAIPLPQSVSEAEQSQYTNMPTKLARTGLPDEDAFHAALDANPEDHTTRLVFADWLDEHGDPRGPGYRALGLLRRRPYLIDYGAGHAVTYAYHNGKGTCSYDGAHGIIHADHALPQDWLQHTGIPSPYQKIWGSFGLNGLMDYAPTRREAEDDAALAFAKLPAERQAELLEQATKLARPKGQSNSRIVDDARAYHEKYGESLGLKPFDPSPSRLTITPEQTQRIVDSYAARAHAPDDPTVRAAYEAFKRETLLQYHHAVSRGLKVTRWPHEGQPYTSSQAMRDHVDRDHAIYYFPTANGYEPQDATSHPPLEQAPGMPPGVLYNDLFRAVHEYFAHAMHGHEFGPLGELRAWHEHARMYSPLARRALTNETLGQTQWFFHGPHKDKPIPERPFPEQRAAVLPEDVEPTKLARGDDTEKAFQRAIENEPDEHTHKLVYADWLQEHGDNAAAGRVRAWAGLAHHLDTALPDVDFVAIHHNKPWVMRLVGAHTLRRALTKHSGALNGTEQTEMLRHLASIERHAVGVESEDDRHLPGEWAREKGTLATYDQHHGHLPDRRAATRAKLIFAFLHLTSGLSAPSTAYPPASIPWIDDLAAPRNTAANAYIQQQQMNKLARNEFKQPGVGAANRMMGSANHDARVAVAKHVLAEAGLTGARVQAVLSHGPKGARPAVLATLAQANPRVAKFAAAWLGLLTGQPHVTVFHPGEGEDVLHVVDSPHPAAHVGEYLKRSGVPQFTIESRGQGSRAYVVNPMDLIDVETAARGLQGTVRRIPGTAVRLGAGTEKDARAAFRTVIDDAEKEAGGQ